METAESRWSVSATLQALNAALQGEAGDGARGPVWFKESSTRSLRSRDFLAPQAALRAMFTNGQVPSGIAESVVSLKSPGVPPIQSCQKSTAGLTVQLERPAVFERILNAIPMYTKPPQTASGHMTEEKLCHVAELQRVALQYMAVAPGRSCSVVHVVSHEEAFQQQKVDLLWRLVAPQAILGLQTMQVTCSFCQGITNNFVLATYRLRHSQMHKASVLKYGDLSQDDTWTEIVNVLTAAAIRFEILSMNHQSQVTRDILLRCPLGVVT
ncbi:hypothetical protein JD844_013216 [Phrynosoma platyrhinos]|uniref:Uncharacterized protein n=1 Tax=Phrynosoma platyrhinos TaxID=52577 RepID=A0ABQ7TMC3_PHRPL|nr:hypothetical protein JD844_013216 [Phrynosoma platyrhinos]